MWNPEYGKFVNAWREATFLGYETCGIYVELANGEKAVYVEMDVRP